MRSKGYARSVQIVRGREHKCGVLRGRCAGMRGQGGKRRSHPGGWLLALSNLGEEMRACAAIVFVKIWAGSKRSTPYLHYNAATLQTQLRQRIYFLSELEAGGFYVFLRMSRCERPSIRRGVCSAR